MSAEAILSSIVLTRAGSRHGLHLAATTMVEALPNLAQPWLGRLHISPNLPVTGIDPPITNIIGNTTTKIPATGLAGLT